MTAPEILSRLRSLGLEVAVRGGQVAVRPAGRVTDELREEIHERQDDLLRLLANHPRRTPAELLRFAQGIFGGEQVQVPDDDRFEPDARPRYAARMPMGKYAGQRIDETPADYLAWALREMDRLPEITRRAIEAHLGCGGDP